MNNLILFSGGLDSTTLLYKETARSKQKVTALFFNYGQKSLKRERAAVCEITKQRGVRLMEMDITAIFQNSKSSLIMHNSTPITQTITHGNHRTFRSQNTEVEFRNGVFITAAISLAMQVFEGQRVDILYGAIKTRESFADCTKGFVEYFNQLAISCSKGLIKVSAPYLEMGKDEIYKEAVCMGVPLSLTWSCYEGGVEPCGRCPACLDRKILEGINC